MRHLEARPGSVGRAVGVANGDTLVGCLQGGITSGNALEARVCGHAVKPLNEDARGVIPADVARRKSDRLDQKVRRRDARRRHRDLARSKGRGGLFLLERCLRECSIVCHDKNPLKLIAKKPTD